MKTLIISPHCDDAIFSLGGALARGRLGTADVCNVFTETNFSIAGAGDAAETTARRQLEDQAALAKVGARPVYLGLPDACLRPPYAEPESYLSPALDPLLDPVWPLASAALLDFIARHDHDLLCFPLGLGCHIDHRIAARCGLELSSRGEAVIFYEDLPYDAARRPGAVAAHVRALAGGLESRVLKHVDLRDKLALVCAYSSQVDEEATEIIRQTFDLHGGERIWGGRDVLERFFPHEEAAYNDRRPWPGRRSLKSLDTVRDGR
ncbi:MAG TPA: PIG-L family deacetylase [Pyrinomonadaceae bacterium]